MFLTAIPSNKNLTLPKGSFEHSGFPTDCLPLPMEQFLARNLTFTKSFKAPKSLKNPSLWRVYFLFKTLWNKIPKVVSPVSIVTNGPRCQSPRNILKFLNWVATKNPRCWSLRNILKYPRCISPNSKLKLRGKKNLLSLKT